MTRDTQIPKTRYPGSKPFTRDDEQLFFGRDEDISKLTTFIQVERTTVLYGKSGLGKTSLLNAGVLPKLESEHQYHIIPVRFGSHTLDNLKHPLDIVEEGVAGLNHDRSFLNDIESSDISLWQHIKSFELTRPNQTILLVFDQFEELFTYPEGVNDFAKALADLLYGRMSPDFQRALRLATRKTPNLLTLKQSEFLERPVNIRVLMSIRSDRMSQLDRLSSHIPSILLNCYELKSLSRAQAEDAIIGPAQKAGEFQSSPFTYQPEALEKILDYLTKDSAKPIESFQLQILCHHVEKDVVIARNDTCVAGKDLGDLENIYQNYYNDSIKYLGSEEEQLKARILIEEGLIFAKEERRITLYEGQIQSTYGVSGELLRKLADTHIIRSEPHSSGGYMYEVSHDTLVAPILKAKARRYQREAEQKRQQELLELKQKRKKKIKRAIALLASLAGLFLLISLIVAWSLRSQLEQIGFGLIAILASSILVLALLVLGVVAILTVFYEFITGESVLSRLRKRADHPGKQKGILTRLGRWLS